MIFSLRRKKRNETDAANVATEQDEEIAEATELVDVGQEAIASEQPSDPMDAPETEKAEEPPAEPKGGLLRRLRSGLSKTSSQLTGGIGGVFTKRRLDDEALEELEDLLILSDMGAPAAASIIEDLRKHKYDKDVTAEEVRAVMAEHMSQMLEPIEHPPIVPEGRHPMVMMMVGVNGNGKTTTLGKLALRYRHQGYSVMLAAADTFRAAATEQLEVWADRAGVPIVTGEEQADPASVAYRALERAQAEQVDVLLIDTAGRLHNKQNLMQELEKITRVLKKRDADAPHHTLMVLDGTTGQNALAQAAIFQESAGVSGFVITKLDGTAKGGVVVALAEKFGLPVHFIGVGETIEDLQPFSAQSFAYSLMDLDV